MLKMLRNRKGFTLVEVMIVVAILALLAAIAIPNLMKARAGADITACKANRRAIEGAVTTCIVKENLAIPPANVILTKTGTGGLFKKDVYDPIGLGYMKATDPYCPSDPAPGGAGYTITIVGGTGQVTVSCADTTHI